VRRSDPARTGRPERGAAAVEFALVMTILIPVMFGIVDYGMWFADSLGIRHGVHQAARVGVVQTPGCTTGTTDLAKMVCTTKRKVSAIGGTTYAMVKVPQGWARGKPLVVCAMVKENGVTGVTPLPSDRLVRAKAELAIEVDTPLPSGASATAAASASDTPPAGADWSWCT
jgi:Flp pilus assembly protein TadG